MAHCAPCDQSFDTPEELIEHVKTVPHGEILMGDRGEIIGWSQPT